MKRIIVTSFLLITAPTFAQEDTATKMLDDVIITSQRTAERELNIPYSTQSVSDLWVRNYQPRTTPEALMGVNGVFVQTTNHGGGSPFLRGVTGNQTLILVDGIRLNNSTFRYGPNQYLNTIDPFSIGKIEVVKGTGSVQYGSDAIGGVLQVFTNDPHFTTHKAGWSGRAVAKYMTGDMEKTARAEAGYSSEKFGSTVGITYRNFGDLIGGDTTGKQSPSGYSEIALNAKTKFLLKSNVQLTLAHQFLQQKHVPVYHKVVLENFAVNETDPQRRMLNYVKLQLRNAGLFINNVEIIGSWQHTVEGRNSRKNGNTTLRKERDEVNTLGLTTNISSRFSDHWTANSGVEMYRDNINSRRQDVHTQTGAPTMLRGLYPNNSTYGNYAVYSLHQITLNKWIVDAGVRYNIFSINIRDTTLGKVQITPSSFVYNGSVLYKLTPQQSVYASFNTGYRAPNIDDMGTLGIVDFRYEIPTSDLTPERTRNFELGYKVRSGKLRAALSAYYMHLNNLITRIRVEGQMISGYPVYQKENVEKGYIKGLEAEAGYTFFKFFHVGGNVSYTYGQSLTRNEPLRRIPPLNGRVITSYSKNKFFISAELLFASKQDRLAQGDRDDNRIPMGGTPAWKTINLYAGYELAMLKFNLGLRNLLDVDYRTHGSGINGVGRSAWLSVAFQF